MRAIEPRQTGFAVNPDDGMQSYYEVFGPEDATQTILFLPTWALVHSRCWKMQVPYFARQGFQVVTFDGRGNGRSDRPGQGYTATHYTRDALAVLDSLGLDRVALVALSAGGRPALQLATEHAERVSHLVLIAAAVRLHGGARMDLDLFLNEPPDREGWNKYNAVHWREQFRDFTEWFVGEIFSEPHSTKPFDDFVGWTESTTPEILIATTVESRFPDAIEHCRNTRCPTLIIHGDDDRIIPLDNSRQLHATIPNSELVVFEGSGHVPNARDPVRTNLVIREFLDSAPVASYEREPEHARA